MLGEPAVRDEAAPSDPRGDRGRHETDDPPRKPFLRTLAERLFGTYLTSDSLRVAGWIGAGGVGLAGANLILAGVLDADAFGKLTLYQAMLSLGVKVGAFGFDNLAVRREVARDWKVVGQVAGTATVVAAAVAAVALGTFDFSMAPAGFVMAGIVTGAVATLSASFLQGDMRLDRAQAILQLPFVVFLASALVLSVAGRVDWVVAAACLTGGYLVAGVVGMAVIGRSGRDGSPGAGDGGGLLVGTERWKQAATFLMIGASGFILLQLERFAIPRLLSYTQLAVFGVAWTVVGSPYKLLQGGIGFALFPKLRRIGDDGHVRALIAKELRLALVLGIGGGIVLVGGGGYVIEWLYEAKYPVSLALLFSLVVAGNVRLLYGVAVAAVSGLGKEDELRFYNWSGWFSLAVAVAAVIALHPLGLVGIVFGAVAGWCARIGAALWVVRPFLAREATVRRPTS